MRPTKHTHIRALIKGNLGSVLYIFALNLLMLIPVALAPIFRQVFADRVLLGGVREWLPTLVLLMVLMAFLNATLILLQRICLLRLINKIELSGSVRYIWRLLHAPLSRFFGKDPAALLKEADAAQGVATVLTTGILTALLAVLNTVFYFLMMLRIDGAMALIVVGLIALSWGLGRLETKLIARATNRTVAHQVQDSVAVLSSLDEKIAQRGIQDIETIKSQSMEKDFFQRLMSVKVAAVHARRAADYAQAAVPFGTLPQVLFLNLLLFVSALRIMDQSFTVGAYLTLSAFATAFFAPLSQVLNVRAQFKAFEGQLSGVAGKLDASEALPPQESAPSPMPTEDEAGAVRMRDVRFCYAEGAPLFDGFNLSIAPGKTVAIVGKSGAGKTTVARLLLGLLTPQGGQVELSGSDIGALDAQQMKCEIGGANQRICVFSASIRDNITLWDDGIADAQVCRAASDACLHEHVTALNGAYECLLGEDGRDMSGGQRQRLEIARALIYDPRIVVLDEALGSLDMRTARRVLGALRGRGCTLIVMTHAVEYVADFDEIIVLDSGKIVARGSHDELMQGSDYYRALFDTKGQVAS